MKKITRALFLLFLSTILFSACKKDKATEIIIEYPLAFPENFEIDVDNVDSLIIRESNDFPTFLDGELAKNNTNKSKIKSAKLVFLRIQVMDHAYADSAHYSNLSDLSEMALDLKRAPIGQTGIASKNIPDVRTKAVNLNLMDAELRDYLKEDYFRMVFKYRKRRPMPNEMPFVVSFRFRIIADPL